MIFDCGPSGTGGGRNERADVPVVGQMNLFNGFRDVANLRRSAATIGQRRELLLDLQQTVLLDVAQTYYAVLRAERSVDVLNSSLLVQEERLRDARNARRMAYRRELEEKRAKRLQGVIKVQPFDPRKFADQMRLGSWATIHTVIFAALVTAALTLAGRAYGAATVGAFAALLLIGAVYTYLLRVWNLDLRELARPAAAVGVFWGEMVMRAPEQHRANMIEVLDWCAKGRLKPHVHATYPLARIGEAITALDKRQVTGKLIVEI